jgi:hypothetical protein
MPATVEDVTAFVERFETGMVSQEGGKTGIEVDALKNLVSSVDGDVVSYAVMGYLKMGRDSGNRAMYQRAWTLAGAYQYVTDDDALMRAVEKAVEADGVTSVVPTFKPLGTPREEPKPQAIHFRVDEGMLASGDVYPLVRLLALERAKADERATLRALRGRCILTFDLPNDGKYVWQDERARRVVKKLFDALPYFPYYLRPDAELRHMQVFYLCLADPAAFAGGNVELSHDSVVKPVVLTIAGLAAVSELTGENHEQLARDMFSAWPTPFVDWLIGFANDVIREAE